MKTTCQLNVVVDIVNMMKLTWFSSALSSSMTSGKATELRDSYLKFLVGRLENGNSLLIFFDCSLTEKSNLWSGDSRGDL